MTPVAGAGATRIALFHTTLPEPGRKPGGVEMNVHRLANALVVHRGLEVTVYGCTERPADALYHHVRLFQSWYRNNKFLRLVLVPIMLNMVDFRRHDILHLHGDDWFFVKRRIPTVRTLHGSAREEARSATKRARKILQYLVYPLEHVAARLATRSLAVGPDARDIYRAADLADNGVDTSIFFSRPKAPFPLFCFIGTWEGRKRGKMVFDAFCETILPLVPEARLYMACDHVPTHPQVIHAHRPDDAEFAEWLARSWVFLYPSLYEGFGIPYIEALASGTAILTTENSGAAHVLQGGRFGVIRDDAHFAEEAVALTGDSDRRRALERNGLDHVRRYAWPAVAARHAALYEAVVAASHAAPSKALPARRQKGAG